MKLYLVEYVERMLKRAPYEFDPHTQSWCASIDDLPGGYAQAAMVQASLQTEPGPCR